MHPVQNAIGWWKDKPFDFMNAGMRAQEVAGRIPEAPAAAAGAAPCRHLFLNAGSVMLWAMQGRSDGRFVMRCTRMPTSSPILAPLRKG